MERATSTGTKSASYFVSCFWIMESNQESTSGFLRMKNKSSIISEKTSSAPAESALTSLSSAHLPGRWVQDWWWSTGKEVWVQTYAHVSSDGCLFFFPDPTAQNFSDVTHICEVESSWKVPIYENIPSLRRKKEKACFSLQHQPLHLAAVEYVFHFSLKSCYLWNSV